MNADNIKNKTKKNDVISTKAVCPLNINIINIINIPKTDNNNIAIEKKYDQS